jgi:hypothetical protein
MEHSAFYAGYRMGCEATLRALGDAVTERDRALLELQAELDDLRLLVKEAAKKFSYLQKLNAAMRETPPDVLH